MRVVIAIIVSAAIVYGALVAMKRFKASPTAAPSDVPNDPVSDLNRKVQDVLQNSDAPDTDKVIQEVVKAVNQVLQTSPPLVTGDLPKFVPQTSTTPPITPNTLSLMPLIPSSSPPAPPLVSTTFAPKPFYQAVSPVVNLSSRSSLSPTVISRYLKPPVQ